MGGKKSPSVRRAWIEIQLGRPINPDALRRKLLQAGACRIDLTAPVYTQLAPQEAPKLSGEAAVTYNGVL